MVTRLVVLKDGKYNDEQGHVQWLKEGAVFTCTTPYGRSLVASGYCRPDVPIKETTDDSTEDVPAQPEEREPVASLADSLLDIGIPIKTARAMQIRGIESLIDLRYLLVNEEPEVLDVPGVGPATIKKLRVLVGLEG